MERLEKDLRKKIVKALWIIVWGCLAFDVSFFLTFFVTDTLEVPVLVYILQYILPPFAVNMVTFLVARHLNQSEKYDGDFKNMACSVALCTVGGSMGIFHSYYTPLWCAPGMAVMICTAFHNRKLFRAMSVYSCVLVMIAFVYVSLDRMEPGTFYLEHCIVVLGLTVLSGVVADAVQKHQLKVEALIRTTMENKEKYRERLQTDVLTGVHSREYMQEVVRRSFGIEDSSNPIGIAVLDLDNFKQINDQYGHDNGDKVLQALGKILRESSSEEMEVGRFGGEEFLIIFKGEEQEDYEKKMNELRKQFSECGFDFMDGRVSFSAGLVKCKSDTSYEKAFHIADQALYQAKARGKNRVIVEEK